MRSIRAKFTLTVVSIIIIVVSIATVIGVISIKKLGRDDADQMIYLTATTGALNLELYFESVGHSVRTVSTLVSGSFDDMQTEDLSSLVENARVLFSRIANNTNGVLTYYFRIDPEFSKDVPGFWYVYEDEEFIEHEVTDITQYDTSDTSTLVWFTVPKSTGEGVWLPPYYTENLGTRVISYNEPIYWNGQFIGVIGCEIDYETLKQEVENISIFDSGYAFILDENSNVFYHPQLDSAQLTLETTAIDEPEQFISSNHIRYTYEGIEKEAVWIPLSNGMQLYVCAPVSEINSGWTGMIKITLIVLFAILVIAIIAMMRFTGRITKPLRELTEAAKQMDEGNYDYSLEYDKDDEIGILTRTFKQFAANTKERFTELEELDQQKILINDRLMDCITILHESEDSEVAFNKLLDLVASFYGADRSYVFEFDLGAQRLSNTYEWCAEGIEAEITKLQNLDLSIVDRWIAQFESHGEFYINSTDGELDHDSDEYKILAMQDIQSLMAAPLRLGSDIVGFLGVDNPRSNTNTLLILQAVSSFVVNQLGKQREEQQRMMLGVLTDDYDVLIRSDIDRDTFAVLRTNDSYREYCPELYTYRSLSAFLDRLSHLNEEEYEAFRDNVNIESIMQHLTQDGALYHNFKILDRAGNSTTFQVKVVPVGEWLQSHRILLGIHNIEETVRAEEKQRQLLQEALDHAEEASAAKTAFLSSMSHEIRTPMNAIIGYNTLALHEQDFSEKIRDYLEKSGSAARHLLTLINDILDMSRIESGRMTIRSEEFCMGDMLDQINIMISGQCRTKKLEYKCLIDGDLSEFYIGDETKLKQVIINILGNAVKYTPSGGKVSFLVEEISRFDGNVNLRFTMEDTGIGMDPEFLPRLYDAFAQEDVGKPNAMGSTGLGMAITKSIVDMMNGKIEVHSEKGKGSVFYVSVTLKASDRIDSEDSYNPADLRILIVDDDPDACEHARHVLDGLGIASDFCNGGEDAYDIIRLAKARQNPYNLILMDWKMPEAAGVDISRIIREKIDEDVAIIILTAYNWDDIYQEASDAGVDGFIAKPLEAPGLLDRFRRVIRKRGRTKERPKKANLKGRHILIAEDMIINAEILKKFLEMQEMETEIAENGQICVDKFSESPEGTYDAILMDIRMPVLDGLGATEAIRALDREDAKIIPIIAMSANALDEDVQRSLQAGMNAHLAKPLEPKRLYETLVQIIPDNGA